LAQTKTKDLYGFASAIAVSKRLSTVLLCEMEIQYPVVAMAEINE
jgi:hypothetical protein